MEKQTNHETIPYYEDKYPMKKENKPLAEKVHQFNKWHKRVVIEDDVKQAVKVVYNYMSDIILNELWIIDGEETKRKLHNHLKGIFKDKFGFELE